MVGKRGTSRTHRCPDSHKHDATGTCFNQHGCGCFPCVEGRRVYQLERDRKLAYGRWETDRTIVDATGTRRRMQALAYMGWPSRLLAAELPSRQSYILHLSIKERVEQGTADRVKAMYERLWNTIPPGGRRLYTANMARRKGWVGPLHWEQIDTDPEPVTLTPDRDRAAWVIDELDMLREAGESPSAAMVALGRNIRSTASLAFRRGRPDLGRWLEEAA